MANGDKHGGKEPRIINPNVMRGSGSPFPFPGSKPMMMEIAIPAEQEAKIRKTLQELYAQAKELNSELNLIMDKMETLEKKRDALQLEKPTGVA